MPHLAMSALLAMALCATGWAAGPMAVIVVSEAGVDAYREAVEGVGAALPPAGFRVVDAGAAELGGALENRDTRVVIAVGSRALAEVRARRVAVPVVAAMVLRGGEGDAIGRVELNIPLSAQLATMRVLWPKRARVGIIRAPALGRGLGETLESVARKEGYLPMVVDCDGPAHLLKALALLRGKVDFVLCFPDPDLYNPVTIKPLVLASLEYGLPLVGFSSAFVRAGAAAGIFPDYRDMGRQAAEMAARRMRGEDIADEAPRKVLVALNQRVDRLLGVEFHITGLTAEVYR